MKRLMRRMAAAVLLSACLVSLSACSASQDETGGPSISTDGTLVEDAMGQSVVYSAAQTLGIPKEQLVVQAQMAEAGGDSATAEIYREQLAVREELGGLKTIDFEGSKVYLLADGSYTASIPVTFDGGTKLYLVNINMATQTVTAEFANMSAGEEDSSIGGLLRTATVYTVIGIGTVFAVLVFISLLIYCFKFIHQWEEGKKAPGAAPAPAAPIAAAAPAPVQTPAASADLSGDAELVAVISAAIAAYEGTSSNGLVVRSIRRIGGSQRR